MAFLANVNQRRRWRVKDTPLSPWRDLPGSFTTGELWKMRMEGFFAAAISSEDRSANDGTSNVHPLPVR